MDHVPTDPTHPASDSAAQRHDARDSLFLIAGFRIKGDDRIEQVRIRNLSAGGLMAELPEGIDPDTAVEVDVRGIGWISGKVAWTAVGRVGIAFDKQIDPKKARKPVGRGTRTPSFAKPALSR